VPPLRKRAQAPWGHIACFQCRCGVARPRQKRVPCMAMASEKSRVWGQLQRPLGALLPPFFQFLCSNGFVSALEPGLPGVFSFLLFPKNVILERAAGPAAKRATKGKGKGGN